MSSFLRAARRLTNNATARSIVQRQVDRIANADEKTGAGAVLGKLAGGKASLDALTDFGRQIQSSGSLLDGVQRLTTQVSPDQLKSVANTAVSSLPESIRGDLLGRLANHGDLIPDGTGDDLAGVVSTALRKENGIQQLFGALIAGKGGLPGGAGLNLMAAMTDPSTRELAKSLVSALVKAKGPSTPG